jgi:hypothetical protein
MSLAFFTCNVAATKLKRRYAIAPIATIYARNEKTKDNSTPMERDKTSRDGKK